MRYFPLTALLRRVRRAVLGHPGRLHHGRSHFLELNDRHVGQTVFIIGAGPQLAALTTRQTLAIESRTCIAVNKVFYRLESTYFLSAYIGEVMLAARRMPRAMLLHMRPIYDTPLIPGILSLKRAMFDERIGLPRRFAEPEPILYTRFNVALGATHLAYVMGAARIVYVGVEQRNQLHFYDLDDRIRKTIRADIVAQGDPPILGIDHPYASLANSLAAIDRPLTECMQPFAHDHQPTFAAYFRILRDSGVELIATAADSVVADAGARVMPLDAVLSDPGF